MRSVRPAIAVLILGLLAGACGGGLASLTTRKEVEGNNTGGVIPPAALEGKNAQSVADAHCARWNTRARITFSGADAGDDTIFVCESAAGPAMFGGAPAQGQVQATTPAKQTAPATKQAPVKR